MTDALTILITGGIGSGKSALNSYLSERGVPVYDSDSRTKALYDGELGTMVENGLGQSFRDSQGRFDRKALAAVIFSDNAKLRQLEAIVHPAVLKDFLGWRQRSLDGLKWCGYAGDRPFVCMESAIALDKPLFDGTYDVVVLVNAEESIRVARACARDACDAEAVRRRIRNQHLDMSRADYIIENNGTVAELAAAADKVFNAVSWR